MRVASRRALVAIDLFEPLLPHHEHHWFRKRLKRIRQAAGPARDLDVMAKRLAAEHDLAQGDAACTEGLSMLLERVAKSRRKAQHNIEKLVGKLKRKHFKQRGKKLAGKIHWRGENAPEPTYGDMGRAKIRSLVDEFFAATDADLTCTDALHQVRLVVKRLRYSMEAFADAFGDGFRKELYPLVEELQEKLGGVNDHATARKQYLEWLSDAAGEPQRSALETLIAHETAALQQATNAFGQWWTAQRAAEQRSRFLQELSVLETRCA
jgi:CHAD domain-containing protein